MEGYSEDEFEKTVATNGNARRYLSATREETKALDANAHLHARTPAAHRRRADPGSSFFGGTGVAASNLTVVNCGKVGLTFPGTPFRGNVAPPR